MKLKRIGVLTSGGDAPGMNAAVRAVVRRGISAGLEVAGIHRGYYGLINADFEAMTARSVANIIQRGGTILRTDRCPEFHERSFRDRAAEHLRGNGIDALVVIGGDGSFRGAQVFRAESGIPSVGIPGTIDNDIFGTDWTIGFDTAVNTAMSAIDKIRDTAASHDRVFLVEVMGRHTGFIAMHVGLAGGAEIVVVPEAPIDPAHIAQILRSGSERGKVSGIVIVAEGSVPGGAFGIAEKIGDNQHLRTRVVVLGHLQRGGSPSARDRVLASRLGARAVEVLIEGATDVMVGEIGGAIVTTSYDDVCANKHSFDHSLRKLAEYLSI